jgi:hypothetical protein
MGRTACQRATPTGGLQETRQSPSMWRPHGLQTVPASPRLSGDRSPGGGEPGSDLGPGGGRNPRGSEKPSKAAVLLPGRIYIDWRVRRLRNPPWEEEPDGLAKRMSMGAICYFATFKSGIFQNNTQNMGFSNNLICFSIFSCMK